ncbi:MAG TPA: hypothetical protein VIM44_04035 [Rariglobus sp.]
MGVKIYRAAQSRLLEVWDYTEATWGEEQADALCMNWWMPRIDCLTNGTVGVPLRIGFCGECFSSGIAIIISSFASWAAVRLV